MTRRDNFIATWSKSIVSHLKHALRQLFTPYKTRFLSTWMGRDPYTEMDRIWLKNNPSHMSLLVGKALEVVLWNMTYSIYVCVWWHHKSKEAEDKHAQYDQKHEVAGQEKKCFDFTRLNLIRLAISFIYIFLTSWERNNLWNKYRFAIIPALRRKLLSSHRDSFFSRAVASTVYYYICTCWQIYGQ